MFLDIFILIILAISTFIAFMRGFIREALTLVTITVTLAVTYYGGPLLNPLMDSWMGVSEGSNEKLLGILPMDLASTISSFGIIFITLIIGFGIASHMLAEFVKSLGLGAIDRSLGALFGLLRGAVLLAILYMPLHFVLDQDTKDSWFSDSRSHVYLEKSSISLAGLLPQGLIESDEDTRSADEPATETTKEKLQAIKVLKETIQTEGAKALSTTSDTAQEAGYSEDVRSEIDALIEQNANNYTFNE